ncbi:MAG TPA: type II secretion system protein N, partial [Gammaproteobacteria bacterium]|nr:type II secretion system protein N [Gammaproteobacteria bacterium]
MDVAQRIAQWKDQSPEQWLTFANRYLPPSVTAVLVVAIAYQLAVLTWRVVPGATTQGSIPTTIVTDSSATVTQRSLDFGGLMQSHLFGEAPAEAAPSTQTVVDAPDTTLSLRLTGIIYGEGGIPSQAIIGSNSDQ